jgi:ketosteroid isomerase-like protein
MKNIIRYNFILITGILTILIVSPNSFATDEKDPENSNNPKEQLIKTDKAFSEKSVKEGIPAAFIAYADDDVILMRDGQFPITGKKDLEEYYSKMKSSNARLEWSPVKAEVSESGELGYTFGNWIYTSKDTVYGNYVTIWKKQKDGGWKYILDGGNTTPSPKKTVE